MAASTSAPNMARKSYTLNEVLNMLEEEEDMVAATVYITPPDNNASDGDSGEEDEVALNNLTGQLLVAEAEAVFHRPAEEPQRIGTEEDQPPAAEVAPPSPAHMQQNLDAAQENAPNAPRQMQARRMVRQQVIRQWRRQDLPQHGLPTQQQWNDVPAPCFLEQDLTPQQMFELFFDDELVDFMVNQAQLYASRDKGDHAFQTNRQDMRTFLAILLVSGYSPLPRRRMYWERSADVRNEAIYNAMSRSRFEDHLKYLHLSDNLNIDTNDKLAKVRDFLAQVNERCLLFFPVSQSLCVDESMVPYYGHHSCKQFIRGKPIRFGFKFWCLADPLGYVVQFEPYVGAGHCLGALGLGGSVVMDLMSELLSEPQVPFHVTFDNYFTSLPLLSALAERGIGATGTIRRNRIQQCPLSDAGDFGRTPRGSFDYRMDRTENLLVVQWNDNNVVTLASNCDTVNPLGSARRWSRQERRFVQIDQPSLVRTYNACMGGVDRADQNISKYRMAIRTKKWWWPFFAQAVEMGVNNAWLLYRRGPLEILDLLAFRRSIAQAYLRDAMMQNPRSARNEVPLGRVPGPVRFDMVRHFAGDSHVQKRCALCKRNTKKICQKCAVGLHLHCFNQFHGVA